MGVQADMNGTDRLQRALHEQLSTLRRMRPTPGKVADLVASGQPLQIELGEPEAGRRGWITIDVTETCDLCWDLRQGLPFPDASIEAIYSSHFFEHLSYDEGQSLLRECLRALKPGGTFSICVPNACLYIEAYLNLRVLPDSFYQYTPAYHATTAIDAVNYVAYMAGTHKHMFDDHLLHVLRTAGFTEVRARLMDPARDQAARHFESIYDCAVRPTGPSC
jgi:predicted SAM-dependent methyltransferase